MQLPTILKLCYFDSSEEGKSDFLEKNDLAIDRAPPALQSLQWVLPEMLI